MRTIKFRGKRLDNNEWAYGCLIFSFEGTHIVSNEYFKPSNDESPELIEVHPETVGQFTGLHDKNGNEIYECDILKLHKIHEDHSNYLWEIFYDDGSFQARTPTKVGRTVLSQHILVAYRKGIIEEFSDYPFLFELIGNIHDNPELIKEDKA